VLHQRVLLLGRRCLGAAADNAPALLLRADAMRGRCSQVTARRATLTTWCW
jgi:hypothetical protein